MRKIIFVLVLLMLDSFIYASEAVPTKDEVAKLYVATFNRAPDSAGLSYWVYSSGLTLSGIAQSFFDQSETQTLYPPTVSNREFIKSVYKNLFNREPDTAGWDYWENQLNKGIFTKNRFIEAVINGALDTQEFGLDKTILKNKTEAGLYFSNRGLNSINDAKTIIKSIDSNPQSVIAVEQDIDKLVNQDSSLWHASNALNHTAKTKTLTIKGDVCTITQDDNGIHYRCEGNLSNSGDFDDSAISSALTSSLSNANIANAKDIIIAESNVTNENFTFFAPPIIYKGMMYGSWGGMHTVNESVLVDGIFKGDSVNKEILNVNEYNLSKFNHDMSLESLISHNIYSSDVVKSYLLGNTAPTNLMELDRYLYFTARSKDIGNWNDNSTGTYYEMLKYSLQKREFVYDEISKPLFVHYNLNDGCPSAPFDGDYVAIAKGWMVPSSGSNIAFLDGERETQISMCSGIDVKVIEDDEKCGYSSVVEQNETEYGNPFTISVSDYLSYYALNGDSITKTSFNRQGKTTTGLSSIDKRVNVFDDFKAKYSEAMAYQSLQLLDSPIIDQSKDRLYMLGILAQNPQQEDYLTYMDLYIFEYDTSLKLISAHKIVQGDTKIIPGIIDGSNHFYKYKDRVFFTFGYYNSKPKLYAYNLKNNQIDYTYNLYFTYNQHNFYNPSSTNPLEGYDYAITGGTIVIPQRAMYDDNDNNYEIVFDIIDIETGQKIKTVSHPNLRVKDWSDYKISVQNAYVYANSVYFVLKKQYMGQGDHYTRNILVKIDSPQNSTQITRYRGDNRLSGVFRNFEVESGFKPKNEEQKLIYELYNFLNNPESTGDDLEITLLNTITKAKGLSSTAELFKTNNTVQTYTAYTPVYTPVVLSKDVNYSQVSPLYNQELVSDTQKFYIPLLTKVTYSSSNDGDDFGEARVKINSQYACRKSYFNFPANGSVKIFGFNPVDDSYEFADKNNMPASLSFYPKIPMLMIDYNDIINNQTMLRYGIDAIEHDSLNTVQKITTTIKNNLDSLVSTGISIISGNYVSAICSTANIITNMTVDNLQTGDTYYGSAMKIYTGSSNYGIKENQDFTAESIEGSASSYTIDADSAGDLVEGICSGLSVNPVALYSFVTKADVSEKHISAKVVPTWHKGIVIKHLKVELIDTQFFNQPTTPITIFHPTHIFEVSGYVGTLGTQDGLLSDGTVYDLPYQFEPFKQKASIYEWFPKKADPFDGWNYRNRTFFDSDYNTAAPSTTSSMAGVYIEMVFYSDGSQMGVFSDTLFLDEAIYTDNFTKDGNSYSITITKPFMLPDGTLDFNRVANGNVTYRVTFTVE